MNILDVERKALMQSPMDLEKENNQEIHFWLFDQIKNESGE